MSYLIEKTYSQKIKVGRNDPCPCGSGKKYKKCCLSKDESANYQLQTKTGLVGKAMDWVMSQDYLKNALQPFLKEFIAGKKEVTEYEIDPLMDTFLFEQKVDGLVPLAHFVQKALLTADEKKLYQSWLDKGFFGIFEVLDFNLGQNITVKNLVNDQSYLVLERMGSYGVEKGMIIFGRILPLDANYWMFSGGLIHSYSKEMAYSLRLLAGRMAPGLQLTGYDFLKVEWSTPKPKSFAECRKELDDYLQKLEISFPLEKIEDKITGAKKLSDVFGTLFNQPFPNQESYQETFRLVVNLWNSHPAISQKRNKSYLPGPLEDRLLAEMMSEYERESKKKRLVSDDDYQKFWTEFQKQWLNRPLKSLDYRTPKEVILEERKNLGNPCQKIGYQLDHVGPDPDDEIDQYNQALKLLEQQKWSQAEKILSAFINSNPHFPEIYRAYANLAKAKEMQGDLIQAEKLLKKALKINPNYEIAKKGLAALTKVRQGLLQWLAKMCQKRKKRKK